MRIPPFLYRGDSDLQKVRKLRQWRSGYLLTNLANGGSGREIFSVQLVDSIRRHVDIGWEKTHFLSFTETYSTAEYFAGATEKRILSITEQNDWDTAVITVDTNCLEVDEIYDSGLYRCHYELSPNNHCTHDLNDFLAYQLPRQIASVYRHNRPVPILLIDLASYLTGQKARGGLDVEESLVKASRDTEWLMLPVDSVQEIPDEYTAALDISCVSKFECFKWSIVDSAT